MAGATWDTIDRYMILSSDAHAGAETHQYRDYLDTRWRDDFDAWVPTLAHPFIDLSDLEAASVNWDPGRRIAAMDAQGDTGQVLFPNTVPPFFDILVHLSGVPRTRDEFDRKWAGLRAHNRWLVEFCQAEPGRLKGLVQLMPNEIDDTIAEARWAKETGVIGGVMLPGVPPNHPVPPYFHDRYDRLWAACAELELPVHQHQGTGSPDAGQDSPAATPIWFTELDRWTQRTLLHLIFGGVFERHPGLKFVWTEMWGIRWILEELHRMERRLPELRSEGAWGVGMGRADNPRRMNFSYFGSSVIDGLSLTPTEYWHRNCYVGASLLPRHEMRYRHAVGVDRMMWGMDFPHPEGATNHGLESLRATFYDITQAECRTMLAGVAADVYGFDLDALAATAARIGPPVADVHVQLTEDDFPLAPGASFDSSLPLEALIVR